MTARQIAYGYLLLLFVYAAAELLLVALNLRWVRRHASQLPRFIQGRVEPETYAKAVSYTLAKGRHQLVNHLFYSAVLLGIVLSGFLGFMERAAGALTTGQNLKGLILILGTGLILDVLFVPFEVWSVFGIEERFGFNKMSFRLWLIDKVKGWLVSLLLLVPLLLVLFHLMDSAGRHWWVYAFIFITAFELLVLYIFPVWIAPLFNKFAPLEDRQLRDDILSLSRRLGFRLADVFVMDASRRSAHANAYFTGFGKHKRVVLFDTLCQILKKEEILAVLAHEIGHQKRRHLQKGLSVSLVLLAAGLWTLSVVLDYPPLYAAFGLSAPGSAAALALVIFLGTPAAYFISAPFTMLSRRFEYEADRFAVDALSSAAELENALIALSKKGLTNYTPHPWYSFFHYSHPVLGERLAAMRRHEEAISGGPDSRRTDGVK